MANDEKHEHVCTSGYSIYILHWTKTHEQTSASICWICSCENLHIRGTHERSENLHIRGSHDKSCKTKGRKHQKFGNPKLHVWCESAVSIKFTAVVDDPAIMLLTETAEYLLASVSVLTNP